MRYKMTFFWDQMLPLMNNFLKKEKTIHFLPEKKFQKKSFMSSYACCFGFFVSF